MRISEADIKSVKLASDGFPDMNVSQSEREDPKWCAAWMKAAYGSGGGYWGSKGWDNTYREKFNMLRLYAVGKQPEAPYIQRYSLPKGDTSKSGDGGLLISSDPTILALLPQMLIKVRQHVEKYPTVPQVRANDPESRSRQQSEYYNRLFDVHFREQKQEMSAALGVIDPMDEAPRTEEEVGLFMQSGSYKDSVAMLFENTLTAGLEQVRYDERVRSEIVRLDLIPCGMGAAGVYPQGDGTVKVERIAPENLMLPWSDKMDFHDINWIGAFRRLSSDECKREGNLSPEETEDIRKKFVRTNVARGWPDMSFGGYTVTNGYPIGTVDVIDFYFIAERSTDFKVVEKEGKGKSYYKIGNGKLKDDSDAEYNKESISGLAVYGCTWVIGSDIYWNTGLLPSQPMIAPGKPYLPIQLVMPENYGLEYLSMVEEAAPIIDQLQLSFLRFQNIADKNGPAVLAYVKEVLAYAAAEDKKGMDELFKEMRAKGVIGIDMPQDFFNNLGGGPAPVFQLDINNQMNPLNTEMAIFGHYMGLLMRATGFNEISAGGPIDERKGKAVATMERQSTAEALMPLVKSMERLAVNVSYPLLGYQIACMTSSSKTKVDYWRDVVGDHVVDGIKKIAVDGSKKSVAVLGGIGLSIIPYPDPQELASIQEAMITAMTGRDGKVPMMSLADKLVIESYLRTGRIKNAQLYMLRVERKRDAEMKRREDMAAKQNMQMQQQQAEMQAQIQQLQIEGKMQLDANRIQMGAESKVMVNQANTQNRIAEQQARAESELVVAEQMAQMKMMLEKMTKMMEGDNKLNAIEEQGKQDRMTDSVNRMSGGA